MERVMLDGRGAQRPVRAPSPAGSEATEDEGQRILEDTSASELSDKIPAGSLLSNPQHDPDSQVNTGRGHAKGWAEGQALAVKPDRGSQVDTGRGTDAPAVPAETPVGSRNPAKRGRGPVGDSPLDHRLTVRLTAQEDRAVHTRAVVLGVKPSGWARAVIRDALDVRRDEVARLSSSPLPQSDPVLGQAVEQLRRVGVNLNQTRRAGDAVDSGLLREVLRAVDELRRHLGDEVAL